MCRHNFTTSNDTACSGVGLGGAQSFQQALQWPQTRGMRSWLRTCDLCIPTAKAGICQELYVHTAELMTAEVMKTTYLMFTTLIRYQLLSACDFAHAQLW